MILAGLAFVIAVIGIAVYSLFSNLILDSWFTVMKPKDYDGTVITTVQTFKHDDDVLTLSERPMTVEGADHSHKIVRYLVVAFNGVNLEQGELPIIPTEQAALKINYLIPPTEPSDDERASVEAAVVEEENNQAPSPSYQSQRAANRAPTYLFAGTPQFSEASFNQLVECWKANESGISRCLDKTDFVPKGGGSPVPFDVKVINGLVLGNPPAVREFVSELPGRFYEGSIETLVIQPSGKWKITGVVGPVAAPLESGIVQIRDGAPYLWAIVLPAVEGPDTAGAALADHLESFYDGKGVKLTSIYKVDPFKLIQPTVEEELRAQARKLGIKALPAPPEGTVPGAATPGTAAATPGAPPNDIQSMPGFDMSNPDFQNENPSGLPPETNTDQIPDRPVPY